ncbi:MAG: 2-amino-4-hydroxy-6-hydroxymethyldihydropteridine diphosphokinase [Nitrososphaerota archaeon]|nr:2-amino-4-hydroxy-6-hydroxymethyldihydropteridine diphosphokinase [Nitrososphaerota archaeon]MDG7024166.1 2-amino-4-hydroxy-6-hydroxymethyldihydropteridine diphosphokinase [Nitrososphaerota archaeon]
MVESLIALGSNLGDREDSLRRAIVMVGRQMSLIKMSSVYETEPMYYESQSWFLNCVASVETNLEPRELLERLQAIEREMGRQRSKRYGPRYIDLDILFYGDEIVSEPGLEIPHPKIAERPFVLVPLNEIRPELVHPVLKKSVSELLDALRTDKKVFKKPNLLADLASLLPRQS